MTIPEPMIARTTIEEYRHRHAERPRAGDLPALRPRRHEPGGVYVGTRHRLSSALRSVADRIEPRAASGHLNNPGAHRA